MTSGMDSHRASQEIPPSRVCIGCLHETHSADRCPQCDCSAHMLGRTKKAHRPELERWPFRGLH